MMKMMLGLWVVSQIVQPGLA